MDLLTKGIAHLMDNNSKRTPFFLYTISILYMFALISVILLKYGLETGLGSLNLIPFQWASYPKAMAFDNIFGNVAFFLPFGLLFPLVFRRMNTGKTILAGFLLSLFFEIIQIATDTGGADVDDLILNTCGIALGAFVFLLLKRITRDEAKLRRYGLIFVIIFGTIASAIFLFG